MLIDPSLSGYVILLKNNSFYYLMVTVLNHKLLIPVCAHVKYAQKCESRYIFLS